MFRFVSLTLFAMALMLLICLDADAGRFFHRRSTRSMTTCSTGTCSASASVNTRTVIRERSSGCVNGACPVPAPTPSPASNGKVSNDALDAVNALRAARGLRPFIRCEGLTAAAQSAAQYRAERQIAGHANDFAFVPAGYSATCAGCSAVSAEWGFLACAIYDNYTYCGAASVVGGDGKIFHHAFYR